MNRRLPSIFLLLSFVGPLPLAHAQESDSRESSTVREPADIGPQSESGAEGEAAEAPDADRELVEDAAGRDEDVSQVAEPTVPSTADGDSDRPEPAAQPAPRGSTEATPEARTGSEEAAHSEDTACEREERTCDHNALSEHFMVSVGFSHWYGGTFGAPPGTYTPGLTVGWIPVHFLELQLAYSISVITLEQPDSSESHVGFATLALMLRSSLEVEGERITLAGGILGGIVHTHDGVRPVVGGAMAGRYLIRVDDGFSIGPFLDVRAVLYELPNSSLPIYEFRDGELVPGHSDAQIQIGAAGAFG